MGAAGLLSHIDFCVGDPARSIPFFDTLLTALGYARWREPGEEWQEPNPRRAAWGIRISGEFYFGVDLRPADALSANQRHDRYGPGPHHIAFHVTTRSEVDQIYEVLEEKGATILDPPADYGGRSGYGSKYYAVFFEDPDGVKLEVVWAPGFGPPASAASK